MGTHPIFESDFDCLTDRTGPNLPIMTEQMTFKGSLKGHNGWVTQIATTPIFPDMLLSSSRDKTIIMWHLTREEGSYGVPKRRMQGHSHFVSDVEVSSDGQYALSGSWDATLRLWDLASGNTVRRFVGHTKDVLSVSFSPDNRQILSAARDRTIKVWNLTNCKLKRDYRGHTGYLNTVNVSPDGSLCASGGRDGQAKLWDIGSEEAKPLHTLEAGDEIYALTFSPNRYWLCAAAGGVIKIWDLEQKNLVDELKPEVVADGGRAECISLCWSSDGQTLFSGYNDGQIRVWSISIRSVM